MATRAAHIGQWLSDFSSITVSRKTVVKTHVAGHIAPRVSDSEFALLTSFHVLLLLLAQGSHFGMH